MTWADLIIILLAANLAMVMKRLDQQITYDCPHYCSVDHAHFCPSTLGEGLDCQSDCYQECMERH